MSWTIFSYKVSMGGGSDGITEGSPGIRLLSMNRIRRIVPGQGL